MASKLAQKYEINADMGEGYGRWKMGPDEDLMPLIDAANIACGFHAGDPAIMLATIRLCKKHGVRAGAHPGLPDLAGFGRRRIAMPPAEIYAAVLYQVGALKALLDAEAYPLSHIKPHGELFFAMQRDAAVLRAVLDACRPFGVPVYGCRSAAGEARACAAMGVPFQREMYVDIDYAPGGRGLLPVAESAEATPEVCYRRVVEAVERDEGRDSEGARFGLGFAGARFSVCLHSDMPAVLRNAEMVRKAVDDANRLAAGREGLSEEQHVQGG